MKFIFIGIVGGVALPLLAIYFSDLFLFDLPQWASWPLVGGPVITGAAVGLGDLLCEHQRPRSLG